MDGSGFATQLMDQPFPVPDFFWPGQLEGGCEWFTADLARQAGGTGETRPTPAGCSVVIGGEERVQVSAVGPYGWLTDGTRFIRPVSIAGMEAREYQFTTQGAGECVIGVNTRAPVQLVIGAWNPANRDGGSAEKRCQTARRVAAAVVRRYVPVAGGTPWGKAPQQPGPSAAKGQHACDVVTRTAAVYGHMGDAAGIRGTDPLGTTCTYKAGSSTLTALVTDGPGAGLAAVAPRLPGAAVSDRRLGELPARQEDADPTCALSVEFVPGRIFTVVYQVNVRGMACKYAEVVAASTLTNLIDTSTG